MMFRPILETKPLMSRRDIKVGDVLRTHYGEDIHVTSIEFPKPVGKWKTVAVKGNRKHEGKDTGVTVINMARGYDVTWVRGYHSPGSLKQVWELVRDQAHKGHYVAMYTTTWGKGKSKIRKWIIERDHVYAGYATTDQDAGENFQRVLMGYVFNSKTGKYDPAKD
jgi:hypothetical protein